MEAVYIGRLWMVRIRLVGVRVETHLKLFPRFADNIWLQAVRIGLACSPL